MTYPPTYCAPGEGAELYAVDADVTVKCRAAQTGGSYEVFEVTMPRGAAVPPHREPWAKAFYVLTGRMSFGLGGDARELGPGAFVTVPPLSTNTFRVLSASVTFLAIGLGAGLGDFFADIDRSASRTDSLEDVMPRMLDLAARHGVEPVEVSVP